MKNSFVEMVHDICSNLENTLIEKNRKYGDSARNPVRIFSKASPKEQILVRLDDKISRLKSRQIDEDEDVLLDLLGYLVLLKIVIEEEKENVSKAIEQNQGMAQEATTWSAVRAAL